MLLLFTKHVYRKYELQNLYYIIYMNIFKDC